MIAIVLAGFLVWLLIDLYAPRKTPIRQFDAQEIARLDTEMWRAYYAREHARLFGQLTELLQSQYHAPYVRANKMALHAAQAAFAFKDGNNRTNYEKALPHLEQLFTEVRRMSDVPFDAQQVAELELEWWIIHRERAKRQPGELERALAEAAAALYQVSAEKLTEYARFRTQAMHIRDTKAVRGGVTEADWQQINQLLSQSWLALHQAVNEK